MYTEVFEPVTFSSGKPAMAVSITRLDLRMPWSCPYHFLELCKYAPEVYAAVGP